VRDPRGGNTYILSDFQWVFLPNSDLFYNSTITKNNYLHFNTFLSLQHSLENFPKIEALFVFLPNVAIAILDQIDHNTLVSC
jgi:hypothetical protein